jgi:sn-glycerol 3-phosphate transport system permease protein
MDATLPILISLVTAIVGAFVLGMAFARAKGNVALGAGIGALAGAAAPLLFMLPLNYCTFEAERTPADAVFGIILIGLALALVILPLRLIASRMLSHQRVLVAESVPGAFKGRLAPWLLLAPTLAVLALFLYFPSLETFRLSTLLARLGARRTAFVCVDNFTRLAQDTDYLNVIVTTFGISIAIVVIGLVISLAIATMAYLPIKGAAFYRTLLIWPYAISPAVAGIIFLLLFNPTGGIVNYLLNSLFGFQVGWLNDPAAAPWAVILASVWKSTGYNILFYIAGLQNIPKDLIEAGAIDGANAWQRFRRIVIPLLSPITFFLIITNMTYAFFDTFGTIDYLTGGGPVGATTTMMYEIYEVGIVNNDLGKAAAQSILLFLMVIGLTLLQFRTTGERVNYGA